MVSVDHDKLRETILFMIKHYGTCMQGEDFRMVQVASKICQIFIDLSEAMVLLREMQGSDSHIKLSVD